MIVDDIMNNYGIEFKIFIEDLLKKENQIVKFKIGRNSVVLANQKERKEVDIVEEAMKRISQTKSRREKRKIIEQYTLMNQQWGEMNKYDIRRKVVRDRNKQANKVHSS